MKKLATNTVLCMQPVPQTIVSCRDKDGNNNALVVGFTANVSLDPVMVMVGIVPSRHSHHMVKETGCFLVGLSALMTTTLPSMRETIELLHSYDKNIKVVVGGAVLTPEYAESIGADFYAKEATDTVKYAEKFYS